MRPAATLDNPLIAEGCGTHRVNESAQNPNDKPIGDPPLRSLHARGAGVSWRAREASLAIITSSVVD